MAKASYNHEKPGGLGKLISKASGKEEHKVPKAKGFGVTSFKARIGYTPPTPVHSPIQKASVSVILANYEEEQSSNLSKKSFVFDRMGNLLPISQSLIGWGHKKITLLLALKALFSQNSVTQLLLKLALEVQFSQGSIIQSLIDFQNISRQSESMRGQISSLHFKAKREHERTNFLPRSANDTLIVDQDSNEI